jgi:type II secretory pathway pseudopilin PulG
MLKTRRLGFTLLEVLIGVLVLALALLGLAAMFPVVVRTQRIARDTVVGTGIVEAAEALVRNHEFFSTATGRGLAQYAAQLRLADEDDRTKWQVSLDLSSSSRRLYRLDNGRLDGSLKFGSAAARLRVSDRLNLPSYVQGSATEPTLVWDLAMCLEDEKPSVRNPDDDVATRALPGVRVAIFVRRIDSAVRVTPGYALIQDFIDGRRVPIGSDDTAYGNPTLNGTGSHSIPMYVDVTEARQSRRNGPYDILQLEVQDAASPGSQRDKALVQALGLPGQILVDNLGGVHTVLRNVRRVNGTTVYNEVLLEKGISEKAVRLANDNNNPLQVVLTPQVPVAVRVITIRP